MNNLNYDIVIVGAGIYGLHTAHYLSNYKLRVLIIEEEKEVLSRASLINQARVHNGMHYPRGVKTIESILRYRNKFIQEFHFAINHNYNAYYAIAKNDTLTDAQTFEKMMLSYGIPFTSTNPNLFFTQDMVSGLYKTNECTYSRERIKLFYEKKLKEWKNVDIVFSSKVKCIDYDDKWMIYYDEVCVRSSALINTTYASSNNINQLANQPQFDIKYQLCETVLCEVPNNIQNVGITIMDGNFFSLMPFGFTGLHTLTSVHWTPHHEIYANEEFPCTAKNDQCFTTNWSNCNECIFSPSTRYNNFLIAVERFFLPELRTLTYHKSQFAIKAICSNVEMTDDRETIIYFDSGKLYMSVLSGKFFTFYDMDEKLDFILANIHN